jgi:hypothetical protein
MSRLISAFSAGFDTDRLFAIHRVKKVGRK